MLAPDELRHLGVGVLTAAILAALLILPIGPATAESHVDTVVTFDPAGEFPEGVAVDKRGNLCVSMTLLDQIRVIRPDGTQSVLAQLAPGSGPAGLAVDAAGTSSWPPAESTSPPGTPIPRPAV